MRDYELVVVTSKNLQPKIKKILTDLKIKVKKEEDWGRKDKGIYLFWQIQLSTEALTQLEKQLKLEDEIWRYLLVRVDKKNKNGTKVIK